MPDIFLYSGEVNASDIKLRNPLTGGLNNYTMACTVAAFVLVGVAVGLTAQRRLTATVQTYVLTGNSVTLTSNSLVSNLTFGDKPDWQHAKIKTYL